MFLLFIAFLERSKFIGKMSLATIQYWNACILLISRIKTGSIIMFDMRKLTVVNRAEIYRLKTPEPFKNGIKRINWQIIIEIIHHRRHFCYLKFHLPNFMYWVVLIYLNGWSKKDSIWFLFLRSDAGNFSFA